MRLTAAKARVLIVGYSLILSGALLIFLMAAPHFSVPFNPRLNENVRLIEVVLPVFFGYLGSASHFVFNANRGRDVSVEQQELLFYLIVGPFAIFTLFLIALFFAFTYSSSSGGSRMDFDTLSRWFSWGLALLACTVSVITAYLFGAPPEQTNRTTPPRGRDAS
jgi:hypothetical protein